VTANVFCCGNYNSAKVGMSTLNYIKERIYWPFGYGTVIENIFLVKNSGQVYD
jgi:hypothetical protein